METSGWQQSERGQLQDLGAWFALLRVRKLTPAGTQARVAHPEWSPSR